MRVTAKLGATITAHARDVNGVAFSNKFLATCSGDKTVRLWHLDTWQEAECSPLAGHAYYVNYVVFSPFNTILASCSTDGNVIFWDPNGGSKLCIFTHPSKCGIRVGTFSLNSQLFASGSEDGSICLWDIPSKSLLRTLSGHDGSVLGLAFSPDSLYLVSGSTSGDLRVWDAKYGHCKTLTLVLDAHDLGVTSVDISPCIDGSEADARGSRNTYIVASGGSDNAVRMWHLVAAGDTLQISLTCSRQLLGHSSAVMAVRFSPSGKLLISCSGDHTVRIWKPETAASLHVIDAHSRYVTSCCFSNDGQLIASGSNDRQVRVWNLCVDDDAEEEEEVEGQGEKDASDSSPTGGRQPSPWCPVYAWTADHVARFFTQLGLGHYSRAVYQHAVDGQVLMSLTDAQLSSELGIPVLGHRKKLMTAIEALRCNRAVAECDVGVPDEYLCPVTREIMRDPVIAADGYTYERAAIESWLSQGRTVSPMTNEAIAGGLIPNRSLKMLIQRYLEEAP